ncbi:Fluconazole resistance protein 3 [Verticillium dahliae VDG2]|nr:Fluconazole resistance protein 3 [Verticillium dahliae VDG2]
MADDEKTKAEKLAAAKKRVEAMKKKKNKKAGSSKTKEEAEPAAAAEAEAAPAEEKPEEKADEAVEEKNEEAVEDTKPNTEEPSTEDRPASPSQAQPSLAQQSKLRSASFRKGSISTGVTGPLSPGPFSPDGESATDIYRKHVTRIEELEKENKRLAKDAAESEKRWKKAEEDLADLREEDGDASAKPPASDEQVDKLKSEIAALERQNSQLQQQVSRGTARHGSSPSSAAGSPPAVAELEARLIDKSATIETMELEISKLRAQLERSTSDREQIPALEERVARSEKAAGLAQRELADLRRNLDRTAEKAHGGGGLGEFFQSGINALTGHGGDEDGFLEDDDMDFDEDAFRQAQADDAKARLERIKDIKRGLKNWEGWRLDLVEIRRGGEEGHGEVFEV